MALLPSLRAGYKAIMLDVRRGFRAKLEYREERMKMPLILTLAGLASGSTLARVFVVIALLACNSNAASLQPSEARQKWEDLEVITLDSQGNPANTFISTTIRYSHCQR